MKNIDIFDLPRKIQLIFIAVLCIVLLVLAYHFDLSDSISNIYTVKQQENLLKSQLKETLMGQADLQGNMAYLPTLKKMLSNWQNKLVKPDEIPDVLNQLLKIGAANQLQFIFFSPQSPTKVDAYIKIPINISAMGDYHQLANFISQIANMPWIVSIQDVDIESKNTLSADSNASKLTGNFVLEVTVFDSHKIS